MKTALPANALTKKTINCLSKAGIPIEKESIVHLLKTGVLWPYRYPRNYGSITHAQVCRWAGVDPSALPGAFGYRQGLCPHCGAVLHPADITWQTVPPPG